MSETPDETPDEELDIDEPTEYTSEPEDTSDVQDDNAEGTVSTLMRENDLKP